MAESRKVRPIYDALDARNNKQALKLCNAALQKQPNLVLVKVLKALALERMGRRDEALDLTQEVRDTHPSEEVVLNTFMLVCKSLGKMEWVTDCVEAASAKQPTNQELAQQLFFCHAKQLNFSKQQQSALKLYKQFGKKQYLFWSIASVFLQGSADPSGKLVPLAEGMLQKLEKENSFPDFEAVQMYMHILLRQGKKQAALDLLTGKLGDLCQLRTQRLQMRADLMKELGQLEAANAAYVELICKHDHGPDDWAFYTGYFDTLFQLADDLSSEFDNSLQIGEFCTVREDAEAEIENKAHKSIRDARVLLHVLQAKETQRGHHVRRGPFLAEIDLEQRLLTKGHQAGDKEHQRKLIVKYFDRFGKKQCCFADLEPYLDSFVPVAPSLIQQFEALVPPPVPISADIKQQEDVLRFKQNFLLLSRRLGAHRSLKPEELTALASSILEQYVSSLEIPAKLEPTERKFGDDLALLASHLLLDAYAISGNSVHLVDAIIVLEYGLQQSAHNFQFKLLLLRLYCKIGAGKKAVDVVDSLDVKHILFDTLSHLFLSDLLALPEESAPLVDELTSFLKDASRDCPEFIANVFKANTLSKLTEFMDFKSRLERSTNNILGNSFEIMSALVHHHPSLASATQFLQQAQVSSQAVSDTVIDAAVCNDDPRTLATYDPTLSPLIDFRHPPPPLAPSPVVSLRPLAPEEPSSLPTVEDVLPHCGRRLRKLWLKVHSLLPPLLFFTTEPSPTEEKLTQLRSLLAQYSHCLLHLGLACFPSDSGSDPDPPFRCQPAEFAGRAPDEFLLPALAALLPAEYGSPVPDQSGCWLASSIWCLSVLALQLTHNFLRLALLQAKDSDGPSAAEELLLQTTKMVQSMAMLLGHVTERFIRCFYVNPSNDVVDPAILTALSNLLYVFIVPVSLLLQNSVVLFPKKSKKRSTVPQPGSELITEVRTLLKAGVLDFTSRCITLLQSALGKASESKHIPYDSSSSSIKLIHEKTSGKLAPKVLSGIASSHTATVQALRQCLEARATLLSKLSL